MCLNNRLISTVKYYLFVLQPTPRLYYTIASSVVIQSLRLRLSFSPRLFVIILLRLVSMHSWRRPTGLDVLNIQHFRTFWVFDCGSYLYLLVSVAI